MVMAARYDFGILNPCFVSYVYIYYLVFSHSYHCHAFGSAVVSAYLGFPTERYFDAIIVFPPVRFSLLTPLPYILQTVQIVYSPLSGTSYHVFSCVLVCFYILQFRVVQVSMSCFHTHSFCCPHRGF